MLVPSCEACSRLQAAELTNEGDSRPPPPPVAQPAGFDAGTGVWDVAWLDGLRDVPGDAVWPRLMTVPHPDAVGSLEPEFTGWVEGRTGGRLRWWQRLVMARLLEVDGAGELVWEAAILSMARQCGKSWLLRELLFWRIHYGDRLGGEQLVLHTGKDVAICKEVQRPARLWAKARRDTYHVREVNGQEEITFLADGSRWMIRARDAVYGHSATMVGVDECWKVKPEAIEEGVVPTMVEHPQTQLLLISTAHRSATTLMLRRRADALAVLGAGTGDLLIEWSALPTADLEDRDGWRQASPHWTARRERLIEQRVAAALAGGTDDVDPEEMDPVEAVRAQWLNIWPAGVNRAERGEAVVDPKAWTGALCVDDSVGPLAIGVADHHGRGAAVAFCGMLPDGRLVVGGQLVDSRAEAWGLAQRAALARTGSTLATSTALASDRMAGEVADDPAKNSTVDTGAAVAVLRDLLATGRLVQDGSADLAAQLTETRVNVGARLTLLPVGRHDLVEAMLWAVRAAASREILVPAIY